MVYGTCRSAIGAKPRYSAPKPSACEIQLSKGEGTGGQIVLVLGGTLAVRSDENMRCQQTRAHLGNARCTQHERQPRSERSRLVQLAVACPEDLPSQHLECLVAPKLGRALQPVPHCRRPQALQQRDRPVLAHDPHCRSGGALSARLHTCLDVVERHDERVGDGARDGACEPYPCH
eukprot:scaffold216833_cov27-Tisochrysis_lutea.AAC.2